MTASQRLSVDVMRWQLQSIRESEPFPTYDFPLSRGVIAEVCSSGRTPASHCKPARLPGGMRNRDIALAFLKHFCAGQVAALGSLLADDLQFTGPLYQFTSSAAYLESLRLNPPTPCDHRIDSVTESKDSVSIFYRYEKADGALAVAQLFEFRNHRITQMLLIFDTRDLR